MGIEVTPYQSTWAEAFELERRRLSATLAAWLPDGQDGVHHIGSTSVPGLPAKPVLDLMAGVRSLAEATTAIEPLATLGYAHAPHRPDALWFFRPGDQPAQSRTHHRSRAGGRRNRAVANASRTKASASTSHKLCPHDRSWRTPSRFFGATGGSVTKSMST
ncbi:GrpB family protein [Hamadaea sp. NPDC051192]|uniref:GrpB family protein n=1 Tax=Hamadaea sp. NPDC051192 TaxID=3154940 RepID=UPI00342D361D